MTVCPACGRPTADGATARVVLAPLLRALRRALADLERALGGL